MVPLSSSLSQRMNEGIPREYVLAAIPLILCFSFLAGSVMFVVGNGLAKTIWSEPRRATLPVAGDRLLVFPAISSGGSTAAPIVSRVASPTTRLSAIATKASGDWVRIPSLNVNVPLVLSPSMNDADVLQTLSRGVALYPNGVSPGQPGNTFVSGHSTGEVWKGGYRFAFIHLNRLKPGDVIFLDYRGTRYTYTVTGSRTIDPNVVPALDASGDRPMLTLMSCWPLWTTKNRLLQDAALVAVNPLRLEGAVVAASTPSRAHGGEARMRRALTTLLQTW